jgi:hypothetical protein
MEFQKRGSGGFEKSLAILDTSGGGLIVEMEALLRGTIRRD